jgi:hypothetical protein
MRFSGHITYMRDVRNAYKILAGLFMKSASILQDNTEVHRTEICTNSEDVVYNELVKDRFQRLIFIYIKQ